MAVIITILCTTDKTCMLDLHPTKQLNDNMESVVPIITYTTNASLENAVMPVMLKGGVKHSNNHSPNIITYHLQYISPLYDGRNATVIL